MKTEGVYPKLNVAGPCLLALLLLTACSEGPVSDISFDAPALPQDADRWVVGALHVHSDYTDGAGSVDEIARSAAAAELDFVVITDHWSLDALEEGEEGYARGVLRLVGVEASTEAGHILGLDLPATPLRFGRSDPDEVLRQIRELDGFAMVAHPDAVGSGLSWSGWDLEGYAGIEVFNAYSAYQRNGVLRSLAYLFVSPFWQTDFLSWNLDFSRDLVSRWDRILSGRKLAGWAGVDAHGGIALGAGVFIPLPSYEQVFRMARNYLLLDGPLTGRVPEDRALIYRALREGRGYVALNDRPDAGEFRFWAEAAGERWSVGSDINHTGPVKLLVTAPVADAKVVLLRDGQVIGASDTGELQLAVEVPGVYRSEVHLRTSGFLGDSVSEPWIVSNAISILSPARIADRIDANRLPEDHFASEPGSASEYDLTLAADPRPGCSRLDLSTDDAREVRVRFELPVPQRGEPDLFVIPYARCAVADRVRRDFRGYDALHFETRGDAIYRVSVFLAGPGSARSASGWTASFLTGREWDTVTVPFARFRGILPGDGALRLSDVRGVAFYFDTSNTRPGTSGEVEFRNFSLVPE